MCKEVKATSMYTNVNSELPLLACAFIITCSHA